MPWWCAAGECEANLRTEYKAVAVAPEVGSSRPAPRGYPLRQRVTAQPKGGMMQLRRWIALAEVAGAAERSPRLLACRSQVLEQDALACSQSSWQVGLAEFAATASAAGSGLAMSQCDPGDAAIEVVTSAGSEGSCSSRSSSGSSSRRLLPPRGLGLSDPLAGWLTAGDEPAFVAHARQTLPSDWFQRTFRQQKRFLGKLRRSHFGVKVSVAGSPLLQAG